MRTFNWDAIDGVAATAGPGLIGGLDRRPDHRQGDRPCPRATLHRGQPSGGPRADRRPHRRARLPLSPAARLRRPYPASHRQGCRLLYAARHDLGRRAGRGLRQGRQTARARLIPAARRSRQCAKRGRATIPLPRPMLGRPEPHFSLAGLKTALRHEAMARAPLSEQDVADLCASFQEAAADMVSDRTRRAMEIYSRAARAGRPTRACRCRWRGRQSAAPRRARETSRPSQGFRLILPPPELCTDNAAMVAWAGSGAACPRPDRRPCRPGKGALAARPGRPASPRRRREGLSSRRLLQNTDTV